VKHATGTPSAGQETAPDGRDERAPTPPLPDLETLPPWAVNAWLLATLVALWSWSFGFIRRLGASHHDAEDIRQEAFAGALRNWRTFAPSPEDAPDVALRRWLCGVLLNQWRMNRRFRRTRREVPLGAAFAINREALQDPGHEGRVQAADTLRALQEATNAERWRAWWALEADGYSVGEIADHERVSTNTIHWRIRSAREDFAAVLGFVGGSRRSRGRR